MKICNINYMGIVALFLFSILFVSCKDENKNDAPKIQLDVSEIIVERGRGCRGDSFRSREFYGFYSTRKYCECRSLRGM